MDGSEIFFVLHDECWFKCIESHKNVPWLHVNPTYFQNGEVSIRLLENVTDKNVFLLKRFSSNIHEDIFELLQCTDTLNRMGAKTITLVLPYYPYARQDHSSFCETKGALLLAKMFSNLGVEKVITIDMHAPEQLRNFPLKVINLTPEHFCKNYLLSLKCDNNGMQIIAADKSATQRVQHIASQLNCTWGWINKQRNIKGEIQITGISGFCPEKQVFLMDDLIDTGRTIIAAAQSLQRLGAQQIITCVTHCNLTKALLSKLRTSGISQLVTTDTLKRSLPISNSKVAITVLEVLPLLLSYFSETSAN